jgi:site-specific DNA-methyltransferase (adenine-specific)
MSGLGLEALVADPDFVLYGGDARDVLRELPAGSVDCVVTSPPYWRLRPGADGDLGREATPAAYVESLVAVFDELARLLRANGTTWLVVGDTYDRGRLALIPARLALALDAAGWLVRSDVVWRKPDAIPDTGAKTRPGADHEYAFLLARQARHYYDAEAVRVPAKWERWGDQTSPKYSDRNVAGKGSRGTMVKPRTLAEIRERYDDSKLLRSTWSVGAARCEDDHYAAFPERLVLPMILAGCPPDGVVLDPFLGTGTTALVARKLGRRCVGVELDRGYAELAAERLRRQQRPLFAEGSAAGATLGA